MNHCPDDELVLQYYGESPVAEQHVATCPVCAARARELAGLLEQLDDEVPVRHERYGSEVWYRIRPHLARGRGGAVRRMLRTGASRWVLAAAMLVLLVSGFMAGRLSVVPPPAAPTRSAAEAADAQLDHRVLFLTVADHLERSERVLTDIMNTPGGADISVEQAWADDLISANRLYRQDALEADESSVADVLDELERALLDIVHRPADAHGDFDQIRQRIDSAALLFKVRVLTNELRQRQFRPERSATVRSTPLG
jgi:hypothetical protein